MISSIIFPHHRMAPIDPERLLNTLAPLLSPNGAMKPNEVDKLFGLMTKYSKKLVSKAIYLNILKNTPSEALDLFLQRGGWSLVCNWFFDASKIKDFTVIKEILQLLIISPVNIKRLQENDLPKHIKNLAKTCENEEVKSSASQLFKNWMAIVQNKDDIHAMDSILSLDPSLLTYNVPTTNSANSSSLGAAPIPMDHCNIEGTIQGSDSDPNATTFDQILEATDLQNLDFNPDDFNSTVNCLFIDAHSSGVGDHTNHQISGQEISSMPSIHSSLDSKVTLTIKDGQRIFIKQPINPMTSAIAQHSAETTAKKRKIKKEPALPAAVKPRLLPPSGKPSLKTYAAKTKQAERRQQLAEAKESATAAAAAQHEDGDKKTGANPSATHRKEDDKKSKTKPIKTEKEKKPVSKDPSKSKQSSKSVVEAARIAEAEEKLRLKVAEQKRIRDLRDQKKKDLEQQQKEKDEETLKALKLTSPTTSNIPKIPKKILSFSEMIGIPGSDKERTSIESSKKSPSKSKENDSTSTSSKTKATKEKEIKTESSKNQPGKDARKHKAKVYVSNKSRSLGLLEDLEQSQMDKSNKNKDKDKEAKGKQEAALTDSSLLGLPSSIKSNKRSSTDSLSKPDSKKPKLGSEKSDKDLMSKKSNESNENKKVVKGIQESSLFMDALNAKVESKKSKAPKGSILLLDTTSSTSTRPTTRSKSTRRNSTSSDKDAPLTPSTPSAAESPTVPLSAEDKKSPTVTETKAPIKPVFNFYRDTLDDNDSSEPTPTSSEEKPKVSPEEPMDFDDEILSKQDSFVRTEDEGKLKSCLIIHHSKNKPKKIVQWREEEELHEFHYFEMDETERVNVTRQGQQPKNFAEMKLNERAEERTLVKHNLRVHEDKMDEAVQSWKLTKILVILDKPSPVIESRERASQEEREKGILRVVYFSKLQVPDTPEEPDEPTITNIDDPTILRIIPSGDTGSIHEFKFPPRTDIKGSRRFDSDANIPTIPTDPINVGIGNGLNPAQTPGIDVTQPPPMNMNVWNNIPSPFLPVGGAATTGVQPDVWTATMAAAAAAASNVLPGMIPNVNGFPPPQMNPFGFPPAFPPGIPGMVPQSIGQPGDPFSQFGQNDQGRQQQDRGRFNNNRPHFNNNHSRDRDDRNFRGNNSDRGRNRDNRDNRFDRPANTKDEERGAEHRKSATGRSGSRTVLCKFYKQGFCKTGHDCDFLHPGVNGPTRNERFRRDGSARDKDQSSRGRTSPTTTRPSRWDRGDSAENDKSGNSVDAKDEPNFSEGPSSPPMEPALAMQNEPKVIPSENWTG